MIPSYFRCPTPFQFNGTPPISFAHTRTRLGRKMVAIDPDGNNAEAMIDLEAATLKTSSAHVVTTPQVDNVRRTGISLPQHISVRSGGRGGGGDTISTLSFVRQQRQQAPRRRECQNVCVGIVSLIVVAVLAFFVAVCIHSDSGRCSRS